MIEDFLAAVLGVDGHAALSKAVARQADLVDVLVPRTILSFVATVQELGYKGEIPGLPNSTIALTKSGGVINTGAFTGSDANAFTMAAHLAILLGVEAGPLAKSTRDIDLTRFGKSIDLLVKSRMVRASLSKGTVTNLADYRKKKGLSQSPAVDDAAASARMRDEREELDYMDWKEEQAKKPPVKKTDLPGTTAKPQLTPPDQAAPPMKQPAAGTAKPSAKKQKPVVAPPRTKDKVPGLKAVSTIKIPEMRIKKSEAALHGCKICGCSQVTEGVLIGCRCLSALMKSAIVTTDGDAFSIAFGEEWNMDAVEVLFRCLHGTEEC